MTIEQKIINTALEFKSISLDMGKQVVSMNQEDIDEEYLKKQFESPQKVIDKLFQLLDEYEFQKGTSEKLRG